MAHRGELFEVTFVAQEIIETITASDCELEGFSRVIETNQLDAAFDLARRAQDGKRVSGCTESNIPNDHSIGMCAQAFAQP